MFWPMRDGYWWKWPHPNSCEACKTHHRKYLEIKTDVSFHSNFLEISSSYNSLVISLKKRKFPAKKKTSRNQNRREFSLKFLGNLCTHRYISLKFCSFKKIPAKIEIWILNIVDAISAEKVWIRKENVVLSESNRNHTSHVVRRWEFSVNFHRNFHAFDVWVQKISVQLSNNRRNSL